METKTFNPIEDVIGRLQFINQLFTTDIKAMSNDTLSKPCGGVSRCGHDMIFEITGMLHHFAGLLTEGHGSLAGPAGGFPQAPGEAKDKDKALAGLEQAKDAFISALKGREASFADPVYESPLGNMPALGLANLVILNMTYHSGQLNYIQTIHGDGEFHWF